MLGEQMRAILEDARETGWVLEPEAKRLLALAGLPVPRGTWAADLGQALEFAAGIGYPVAAKVVSRQVLHKTDAGGVAVNIDTEGDLRKVWDRFRHIQGFEGALVEEMASGIELIVGAKMDYQFGPVVLLGMGGTGVEIYNDTALRMAPLREGDVRSMIDGLQASRVLKGYRGAEVVDLEALTAAVRAFSELLMQLQDLVESVDLNPLMCTAQGCLVADARIVLPGGGEGE